MQEHSLSNERARKKPEEAESTEMSSIRRKRMFRVRKTFKFPSHESVNIPIFYIEANLSEDENFSATQWTGIVLTQPL